MSDEVCCDRRSRVSLLVHSCDEKVRRLVVRGNPPLSFLISHVSQVDATPWHGKSQMEGELLQANRHHF